VLMRHRAIPSRGNDFGYIKVHTLNLQDLLYSITPAGRTALAAIDPED
jgi:hypothetical protein